MKSLFKALLAMLLCTGLQAAGNHGSEAVRQVAYAMKANNLESFTRHLAALNQEEINKIFTYQLQASEFGQPDHYSNLTLLHIAAYLKSEHGPTFVEALLNKQADPNIFDSSADQSKSYADTPLMNALYQENREVAKHLIPQSALEFRNLRGQTSKKIAENKELGEIVQFIENYGRLRRIKQAKS